MAAVQVRRGGRSAQAPAPTSAGAGRSGVSCPPATTVAAALSLLERQYREDTDSDHRQGFLAAFYRKVPTACMTKAQAERVQAIASGSNVQAVREAESFEHGLGKLIGALLEAETYIRAAEIIGGAVLVYMGVRTITAELGGPKLPKLSNVVPATKMFGAMKGKP